VAGQLKPTAGGRLTKEVPMRHGMNRLAGFALILAVAALPLAAKDYSLLSPNKAIELKVAVGPTITYAVAFQGKPMIAPSTISMTLDAGRVLGKEAKVRNDKHRSVDDILTPIVAQKASKIPDVFNELTLEFAGNFALIFRAYDDGVAYRFSTSFPGEITVVSEQAEFAFGSNHKLFFPEEESLQSHQERIFKYISLSEVTAKKFSSCPAVVDIEGGPKVAVTEADLEDYAGLWLTGADDSPTKLVGKFPSYPLKEARKNDRNVLVAERAPYLAKTTGKRSFPWRVLMIAAKDGDLIESPMIYRLAKPSAGDFSWVRPGKVAWDWWNDLNLRGVDFRAGVNTATYKYFIDFAAANGIEYVILDEGWYKLGDLLSVVPAVDMEAILSHAKEKNVGIILWVVWKTLDDQFGPAMEQFTKWGVKGLKVDFMQRDDQSMVNYYYKVAAEAAKRHFLIDFHGAYKPTGLYRTFPNVLTSEGVKGLENSKWSREVTPEHDVTLPFTRMAAGPMDFTPGAMVNGGMKNFQIIYSQPMSQGTRCHQLGMYVVYESPLQMLCDTPSNYLREPECLAFLSKVPTTWDETRVMDAKIADYVLVARRKGTAWYIGAMTDATPRELTLDLTFLEDRPYDMTIWQDGVNVDRDGNDYAMIKKTVSRADRLSVKLAAGGGWVAVITPK
jgi:alpha-glucosidase